MNLELLKQSLENGNADEFVKNLELEVENKANEMYEQQKQAILEGYVEGENDPRMLERYNLRKLNADEKRYFENAVETFEKQEDTFPVKTFERIFEDLREKHPLLSKIRFYNTTGITEWLFRTKDVDTAWWGPICEEVKQKLSQGFKLVRLDQKSLSASIVMCKAMLKLSPQWLERLIREMLMESMAQGIEKGIINGTGKDEPTGMLKDTSKAFVESTGYADKTATPIKEFSPLELGKLVSKFSKGKVDYTPQLTMIINPKDYWEKVFPAYSFRNLNGEYVAKLPINIEFIQSRFTPEGKAIIGNLDNYFFGVASPMTITDSVHYQFLERNKVYIAEMLANGMPVDNDSFMVLDVSKLGAPAETTTAGK